VVFVVFSILPDACTSGCIFLLGELWGSKVRLEHSACEGLVQPVYLSIGPFVPPSLLLLRQPEDGEEEGNAEQGAVSHPPHIYYRYSPYYFTLARPISPPRRKCTPSLLFLSIPNDKMHLSAFNSPPWPGSEDDQEVILYLPSKFFLQSGQIDFSVSYWLYIRCQTITNIGSSWCCEERAAGLAMNNTQYNDHGS